jgi:uncharacterized alkaline shock family protein YloU
MANYSQTAGKTTIAPGVLHAIARLTTLEVEGVSRMCPTPTAKVNRLFKRPHLEGVDIEVTNDVVYVDLYIVLREGCNIRDVGRSIQSSVARAITDMVGMQVGRVNIHVEDIDYPMEIEA